MQFGNGLLRLNYGTLKLANEIAFPLFSRLKMENDGDVKTFYEKITLHGKRLNATPEMLQSFFVGGLLTHIKTYVMLRQPNSLSEAFQLAREAEIMAPADDSSLARQLKD